MEISIENVLKGKDQIGAAFSGLETAFKNAGKSGSEAERKIFGVSKAFSSLADSVGGAGRMAGDFAENLKENFTAVSENHNMALEGISKKQEDIIQESGQRLLNKDAETGAKKLTQMMGASKKQLKVMGKLFSDIGRLEKSHNDKSKKNQSDYWQSVSKIATGAMQSIAKEGTEQSRNVAAVAKAVAIARALFDAYQAANRAMAETVAPPPAGLINAAAALAKGLANVNSIRKVSVAHGGLENVPEDSTFLLRRGERVISPNQNRDLTSFLNNGERGGGRGEIVVQNMTVRVLENATSGDALLSMDPVELRQAVAEKIIPALEDLARQGIRPDFLENNT